MENLLLTAGRREELVLNSSSLDGTIFSAKDSSNNKVTVKLCGNANPGDNIMAYRLLMEKEATNVFVEDKNLIPNIGIYDCKVAKEFLLSYLGKSLYIITPHSKETFLFLGSNIEGTIPVDTIVPNVIAVSSKEETLLIPSPQTIKALEVYLNFNATEVKKPIDDDEMRSIRSITNYLKKWQ